MIMGLGLLTYDFLLSRNSYRWTILLVAGALGLFAAFTINNNPIGFVISHLMFSPESVIIVYGHGRRSISTFHNRLGLASVLANSHRRSTTPSIRSGSFSRSSLATRAQFSSLFPC